MDSTTTATTIAIKDLSLISSPGKTVVQSKEKLLNMNSSTKRSSRLPRSRPTAADPGSKTTASATKTVQRVSSEASKLPSKFTTKKNTSNDGVGDGVVNKTNEKNITNLKNVSGGKPISSSKIHRNTALSKTRNPSKSACPKNPSPSSECMSGNDSPALDELKVVTELNDKFRPRSDSESSHASHSSFCSQLSTSSVKSSICLPSADKSGLSKTKKTLTSSCSRLAVTRSETRMQKQPSMLSRTASSTTVTRASNSALSSVSKTSADQQASRLRTRLGTENLQRAVSTGSLRNTNSKLSIPTGRSHLSTTANKTNAQPPKTKKVTNSTSDLSASNRTLNKSGTKAIARGTTRTISTENLSAKHQNSLGKSCDNLTRKPRSMLQASCENLSSKARSNRTSASSNNTTDTKSSLVQSKKSSLSRSSSSSSSSLVQQREKSGSCASLAKDQRHVGLNGSTSSLPTAEKSDNKHLGNTRTGTGIERKATGIGGVQGSKTNLTDKSQVRRTTNVTNKKVTPTSNTVDSAGKKKTLPRAPRNIGDQKSPSATVTPTTKSSFGMKKSKLLENQSNKGVSKIPDKRSHRGSPAKTSSSDDSNKTELSKGRQKSVAHNMHDTEEPCYKTNEISFENEEKLNEDNSVIKGKVSKNFAYDDYMLITDALSYENLSEPDVYNDDSDREDRVNHIRSPDKGLLRNNLSTSSLDISLHEDYVSDEGVVVTYVTSDDHLYQQEQEEFPPVKLGKQASYAPHSTAYKKDIREKDPEVKCELSNHDVIKSDVYSDKTFHSEVIYKSNLPTPSYHNHHQQQQQPRKHLSLPSHNYHHHDHSQEFRSGLEEEREKKQGVTQREGKGICGGPGTDIHSVNDRECFLTGKIKQGEEMEVGEVEEEDEKEEEVVGKERREAEDKEEEVVPVVGLESADIYRTGGPGMPKSEFGPPHIGQHQHPQYITSRNEHIATGGCNLVGTGGSTSEEVTESTTETAGTTVAGGKAVGTRRQLGGGYEKQNYPVHKTATTTTTQLRGGDKTGLLTQVVAGKVADSLDFELQSKLDVESIASLVERTNVCHIDRQKMTDPLGVPSKQSKFDNYQSSLADSAAENSCETTEDDDADATENLTKEDLPMEGPASHDLVTRVRGPFLASEMGILGGQMLSPCSNDSSSFRDMSDDVVTPLSEVQFDHDAEHSDNEDVDSNYEQNEDDDGKHVETPGTGEESDSGSVLIEIEDSPLEASVGNDEGEIIVEEQDCVSEERNYSDSNSSFVSDMIMGERPIVDAGEDLAEVTLDGNETQNLWLAIETESQFDNMSACMTLENIAESSIGEDVEELFDQSPNVEIDNNSIGIPDKVPNKKLDFFKDIPSQEFYTDSLDLPDRPDGTDIMIEKNSVEIMLNNTNEQELPPFDDDSSDREYLLHSSVFEICKPVDSLDENNPPRVADMTVDNFRSQVPKEMFLETESQEGYLPDIDVNSNEDIQSGKCNFSDPVYHQKFEGSKQISCYNVSQEINLEDGNFSILKTDGSKKSKDAQDFALRQLQGTLNLGKQRILELCGQTEGTPNKNQKPPPSPSKATEKTKKRTSFGSADTLNTSPQGSSLSPSPTRLEDSASNNIPNSEMVQSSGSNSDGASSPMKESWIKHEGKWARGCVLDDGECLTTAEYKEYVLKSPISPNSEIIQDPSEGYKNMVNSDFDERSHPHGRPANIDVDKIDNLDQNLAYEEAPTPVARSFKEGTEKILFNTNELMSESFADENMDDTQENEYIVVQETQAGDKTSSKRYDSVDGIQRNDDWTDVNNTLENKNPDVFDSVENIQEPPSVECDSSRVQLKLPLKSPTDVIMAEQKSFSPEIVDDIPFVDMDYTESVVLPSSTDAQEMHSPEIKDVMSLREKDEELPNTTAPERTDATEVKCFENSPSVKPFSGPTIAATRPINLDIIPSVEMGDESPTQVNLDSLPPVDLDSVEMGVKSLTGLNNVAQVNLDGLPPVNLDKVLVNDSTDVSSVDLENEPSVEPDLSSASKDHFVPTDVESISELPGILTEELNKESHSEDVQIKKPEKMPEELNTDLPSKTDVLSQELDSNQPAESGILSEQDDKCLPKMDITPQNLSDENLNESIAGSHKLNKEFPEDMEILHHELDNEQPEECDTPPADYISNFDSSGTRTPVNVRSVTPVNLDQSSLVNKRFDLDRKDPKTQQIIRPNNFEREIQQNSKRALKPPECEERTLRNGLSVLKNESELCKSDQDLTKVGSLCDEIFSIIGSPNLLQESWKTISSESSYEDASDMSSSQMESDDGSNRYSGRFSGSSGIYRSKSGSRSIYANIIRSSIHETSDSESSDYQDPMSQSAQDYENLKRTKEKANNKLKGRGYWSDENSPDSFLSSMDLYSDASEFAHACWSDRSTFGDAAYHYAVPYKFRGDSSAYGKSAYAMKPEESHDIKLLAEISELDETYGDSSHIDFTPGSRISDPTLRSTLTCGEGYWSPVSSPPTRKPYRRSLGLPFATRDGEGGRAALIKADLDRSVNADALGSPPELPSKVGRSQRKHNTVLNWLKDRHTISLTKVCQWKISRDRERKENDLRATDVVSGNRQVVPESPSGVVHRKSSVSYHERPESDIDVRWAQLVEQVSTFPEPRRRLREPSESTAPKPRPKSDLGGSTLASEAMKELLIQGKLPHSQSQKTISEMRNSAYFMSKSRRMSTPHPIKTRFIDRTAPTKLRKTLGRSFSMPENLNKIHKRRRLHPSGSDPLSDLHSHSTNDDSSDESEISMDYSLPDKCHSTRTSQLGLAPVDEIFETENLTYAEALWDHVTMDPDELAFRAGDVIKVTDMLDKDWWWGILDDKEGWFPANFVRLRANQEHHLQDAQKAEGSDPSKDSSPNVGKSHQYSVSSEQARTNVINEIITAEREYVRQLDDVLEGYVVQAKKRPDMFPEEKTATIFGNLEDIYIFSKKFLKSVEISLKDDLHLSEIGHCFIEHKKGFEIYSDYCNNHPHACDQLKELCKNKRYRHFFEGCRLLQEMKQIPLEGFLLTPVQKICKYPLQLAELLKYTSTEHPDYQDVCEALDAMKKIACLINERKRRMESIEKIAQWQATVEDWEGPDLLETSSELIYSGELSKVNSSGWTQERYFFLFDHQLIYCRKDLLKKNSFSFRGRIYLDHSRISQVADGRDAQFNVYVKNGWKLHDDKRNKSFLVFSKNAVEKDRWLKAFDEERRKVKNDQENGFTIPANLRKSCVRNSFRKTQPEKPKEKLLKKNSSMSFRYQQEIWKNLPAHATLPRGITNPTTMMEGPPHPSGHKKRSWFSFTGKKSKR